MSDVSKTNDLIADVDLAEYRARAALVAAQGAEPQADSGSRSRIIDLAEKWADEKLGGYIARTSFMQGVRFALEVTAAPVLPSSNVDELAKLIRRLAVRVHVPDPDGLWSDCYDSEQREWQSVARAVAAHMKGETE